jgi:hypothetical protein
MPNDSVNIEKHKKLYVEYMRNYRQCKAQEIKTQQTGKVVLHI